MKRYGALLGTLLLVLLMACTVACERKPLYLQVPGNLQVETSVYDIKLEIMWGFDWQTRWQYVWDELEYGKMGYSGPTGVRSTIYSLDENLSRSNFFTQNFSIHGGRISLQGGEWYDLLFYNNGTEYILFESDEHYSYYNASTRSTSRSHYVQRPRTRTFVDYNQPDEFFAVFMEKNQVSIDPEDYTIEYDENGGIVYVSTLNAMLPHCKRCPRNYPLGFGTVRRPVYRNQRRQPHCGDNRRHKAPPDRQNADFPRRHKAGW